MECISKYAWSTWDKSQQLLGFTHNVCLEEGIGRMWKWANNQPNRERKIWKNYEINSGLYEYWKK